MDPSRGRLADVDRRPDAASEPRQRWRITFARDPVDAEQVGRAAIEAWQQALAASGLPLVDAGSGDGRSRLAFAAPLPAAARGERELLDVWLLERLPAWRVRELLQPSLPGAHRWVEAESVWLGAPALAAQVVAADWRIDLEASSDDLEPARIAAAIAALSAARAIPRTRLKGTTERSYDLRPLLLDLRFDPSASDRTVVHARTRFDPALGAGRPEEVVGALADTAGLSLTVGSMTRTRLILADALVPPDPPEATRAAGRQPLATTSARPGRN
jgi:uncharacterized protein DUF2344